MKYNLYKILNNKDLLLIEDISNKGFKRMATRVINNFELTLYLKNREIKDNVTWTSEILPFFDMDIIQKEKNPSAVIHISNQNNYYCLTFGYGHFYVKNFIDSSFPFEYLSRINMDSYTNVGLNNHLKNKTKTINAYKGSHNLPSETGSSVIKITGIPSEAEDIGTHIEVGDSIQIFKEMNIEYLTKYITKIENVIMRRRPKMIPRISKVKDVTLINELFEEVVEKFNLGELTSSVDQLEVIGTYYVFNNIYDSFKVSYRRKRLGTIPSLGIDDIRAKLLMNRIEITTLDELRDVWITCEGSSYSDRKRLLDIINYLNDNNYHLIQGKWYKFNNEYINQLNNKIEGFQLHDKSQFNVSESDYFLNRRKDIPKMANPSETRSEYFEEYFNRKVTEDIDSLINVDRDIRNIQGYRIEPCDIYDKNEKNIIAVKVGTPQKIAYVVDQIITSIVSIKTGLLKYEKEINKASIWLVLKRESDIKSLSEIKSILLKIKLVEWVKLCQDYNIQPQIYISYRKK